MASTTPDEDDDYWSDDFLPHVVFTDPRVVAFGPKLPALLSLIASTVMLGELWMDLKDNKSSRTKKSHRSGSCRPLLRALVGLCIADCLSSAAWFLSTWMYPRGTVLEGETAAWAYGTTSTCTFEGFLLQLGIAASPLFNTVHAVFSLLILRYRWRDDDLKRIEPYVHASNWTLAFGQAIFPIFLDLYNPSTPVCWIDAYPQDCEGDECERGGDYAFILAVVLNIFPVWVCIIFSAVCVTLLWRTVRETETRLARYRFRSTVPPTTTTMSFLATTTSQLSPQEPRDGTEPNDNEVPKQSSPDTAPNIDRERSDMVKKQAIWYMAAFIGTYAPSLFNHILLGMGFWFITLNWIAYFIMPGQGIFNFLVFARTRTDMKTRPGAALRSVLCCTLFRQGPPRPPPAEPNDEPRVVTAELSSPLRSLEQPSVEGSNIVDS